MSDPGQEPTPEILPVDEEREILFDLVIDKVMVGLKHALRQDLTVAEGSATIAGMVTTGVLGALRTMSGRQVAVLLAAEANRHAGYVIHEPPVYRLDRAEDIPRAAHGGI